VFTIFDIFLRVASVNSFTPGFNQTRVMLVMANQSLSQWFASVINLVWSEKDTRLHLRILSDTSQHHLKEDSVTVVADFVLVIPLSK